MDVQEDIQLIEDGFINVKSADEGMTDSYTSIKPSVSKNRSKRKPSKTQIKHIAPNSGNNDTSKYGTHKIGHFVNGVTNDQSRRRQSHFEILDKKPSPSKTAQPPVTSNTRKWVRKSSQATSRSTSRIRSLSSPSPPSYPCGICGKIFSVPSRYKSHMLGHSKGKSFCCSICGKMFSTQDKLNHHLPVHSTDRSASFTCETCNKICVNWRAYLYHLKAKHTESGGKRFACSVCGRQFHTVKRLRNHLASHEVGKNDCCSVCGKLFESRKKLDIHSLVHNLTSKHNQNLQCSDCGRQYTEWIAFKQHMKTHGSDGILYPCGVCDMVFPTQYEKEKHKRVHKQVQCEFCERFFRSASVLSIHVRVHTGERPYKCGLCERDFSQASVLKTHMRTHRKEDKYECTKCGMVYQDINDYFKHHMGHLEEGSLQCEDCGKIFQSIGSKNRHIAANHNRVGQRCQICDKDFNNISHLEAHMMCHSDQPPLLCQVCQRVFPSEEDLSTHYTSHTSGECSSKILLSAIKGPLFCGLCGKMFKSQIFLKKHMKRHEQKGLDSQVCDNIPDEDIVEVKDGEFACSDCSKTYGQENHLIIHRQEHTGEHPNTCILCGQSFVTRKFLLEHVSKHELTGDAINNSLSQDVRTDDSQTIKTPQTESESCSETETDHEENQNIPFRPCLVPPDQQRQSPNLANPFHDNSICNNSQSISLPEKNYHHCANKFSEGCLEMYNTDMAYKETLQTKTMGKQFAQKNYTVYSNTDSDKNALIVENSYLGSSSGSFSEKYYLSSNISVEAKHSLEIPNPTLSHNSNSEKISNAGEISIELKYNQSLTSNIDGCLHAGIYRKPYSLPVSSSNLSSSHLYVHSNMQGSSYSQQNFQIPHSDHVGIHFSMKDTGLSSSVPRLHPYSNSTPSIQITSPQNSPIPYDSSYNKSYISPTVSNSSPHSSLHGVFYNTSNKYPSNTQMSDPQLLPQTAFPENSHQM